MSFENPYAPPAAVGLPAMDEISRRLEGIEYPLTFELAPEVRPLMG
jgi:hypothetical protein